jgi:hypothetical protein
MVCWTDRHNFEREPPKDHSSQVWFNLIQWFSEENIALIQVSDYRLLGASGLRHALIEEIDIGLMYDDIKCIFRDETT